jgi:hypothetical protein
VTATAEAADVGTVTQSGARGNVVVVRRRWDPRGWSARRQVVALVALITFVNFLWLVQDQSAPSWDQSHYLDLALQYRRALREHGLGSMIHAIYHADPGRAPLLSVLLVPLSFLFQPGNGPGYALNLILWPILLLSAGDIARHFFGHRGRLLAIVLLAPMPAVVSVSHSVLQEFLLCTLSTVMVMLLLRSRGFSRTGISAWIGVVVVLGELTKLSFGVAVAGPGAVVVADAVLTTVRSCRAENSLRPARRPVANAALLLVIAGVPCLVWYIPNWAATKAYLHLAFMIQPGTQSDPLSLQHSGEFVISILNDGMSWPVAILVLAAVILSGPATARTLWRGRRSWQVVSGALFLASWVVIPYFAVAASTNHDLRYVVAFFPAFAVVGAGLMSRIARPVFRRTLAGAVAVVAFCETAQVLSGHWRIPFLPQNIAWSTRWGTADIRLAHGLGSASTPGRTNYTTLVLDYIEARSRNSQGQLLPKRVAILELQGAMNGNDLPYYALARNDPFTFDTLFNDKPPAELAQELKGYDFALYISQPPANQETANGRVGELNATAAAREMTPAMFRIFQPRPALVAVGSDSGQGHYVQVLERRP